MKKIRYCGECKYFLSEDVYGYGYCKIFNEERRCSQLCKNLECKRKSEKGE